MNWDEAAQGWLEQEAGIEAAHKGVLDLLLDRAALRSGQAVLDIGTGSGSSLLRASGTVGPEGRVLGMDISPRMVARASERAPENASVVVGDAGRDRLPDSAFDAGISLFGLMFFEDTTAAFAHMRRAFRPGAALTFAAWGAPARNPWFGVARKAVADVLGPLPPVDPTAPGPFRFADAARVSAEVEAAGWSVSVETGTPFVTPPNGAQEVAEMQMRLGAAHSLLSRIPHSDAAARAIRDAIAAGFAAFETPDGLRVPAEVNVFRAINPA